MTIMLQSRETEDLGVADDKSIELPQETLDKLPPTVKTRIAELNHLIEKYPYNIPTDKAAKFLKMELECLRRAIEQNKVPFALGCDNGSYGNRYSYISSMTFYLWCLSPIL